MFSPSPDLPLPAEDTVIWRYCDLSKLLDLVIRKEIWFNNSVFFEDPYEGYYPPLVLKEIEKRGFIEISNDGVLLSPKSLMATWEKLRIKWYGNCYLNCWHMNEGESAAMWKLYLSAAEGIAIKTTLGKLQESFRSAHQQIQIGQVRYKDVEKLPRDHNYQIQEVLLLKRKSFRHETEVRAIYLDAVATSTTTAKRPKAEITPGKYIKCDPAILLDKVYVAPTCKPFVKDVVRAVLTQYGLGSVEVIQSELYTVK